MHRFFWRWIIPATILVLAGCDTSSTEGVSPKPGKAAAGDLVGWWKFDEEGGTTVSDSSGNDNTATIVNGGRSAGKIGNALQMDGGNDSIVTIPLSDSLRSTADSITVMGWAYRTAEHNVDLVGHGFPPLFLGFHGPRFKWQIQNTAGKKASCYADRKYHADLNRWFHLAGTYDGRTARLYVDGEEICSVRPGSGGPIKMPEVPFTISGYLDKQGKIIDEITGKIDDVRIYNGVLSAEKIRDIYNAYQ
jgi:hypothetical protein